MQRLSSLAAAPLSLLDLPGEARSKIYRLTLVEEETLPVCQQEDPLAVFDEQAKAIFVEMANDWSSYHFCELHFEGPRKTQDSFRDALAQHIPVAFGNTLQEFSFLRRNTTIYTSNSAPQEMQSCALGAAFAGSKSSHILDSRLLAACTQIRREAGAILFTENTFHVDDIETAASFFANLDPTFRPLVRHSAIDLETIVCNLQTIRVQNAAQCFNWMMDHWRSPGSSTFPELEITIKDKWDLSSKGGYVHAHNTLPVLCRVGRVGKLKFLGRLLSKVSYAQLRAQSWVFRNHIEIISVLMLVSGLEKVEVNKELRIRLAAGSMEVLLPLSLDSFIRLRAILADDLLCTVAHDERLNVFRTRTCEGVWYESRLKFHGITRCVELVLRQGDCWRHGR